MDRAPGECFWQRLRATSLHFEPQQASRDYSALRHGFRAVWPEMACLEDAESPVSDTEMQNAVHLTDEIMVNSSKQEPVPTMAHGPPKLIP